MVLETLSKQIIVSLSNVFRKKTIDQTDLKGLIKNICNSLLEADVGSDIVLKVCDELKKDLLLNPFHVGSSKWSQIYDRAFGVILRIFDTPPLAKIKNKIVMFVGLQGAGKTTSIAKMANYYKQRDITIGIIAGDLFRAGAFDQLYQLACKIGIEVYGNRPQLGLIDLIKQGIKYFRDKHIETIFIDTSGRHKQCQELFDELSILYSTIKPDHVVYVLDATIGQSAGPQSEAFKSTVPIGSIILTKLDSGAKGGGAITAVSITKAPISFIGTGEGIGDFDKFKPLKFVNFLFGKGDLKEAYKTMVKTVKITETETHTIEKIIRGKMDLRDFSDIMGGFEKMGSLSTIVSMMPSASLASNMNKNFNTSTMKKNVIIIDSIHKSEISNPNLLFNDKTSKSRILRIAKGSGTSVKDVETCLLMYKTYSCVMKDGSTQKLMSSLIQEESAGKGAESGGNVGANVSTQTLQKLCKKMYETKMRLIQNKMKK